MSWTAMRWLGSNVNRVFLNAVEVDHVYWNGTYVFQRAIAAGSVTFDTVGGHQWVIPLGLHTATFCVAGAGGGGGALRGGGGGGGGALTSVQNVDGVYSGVIDVNVGAGGAGTGDDYVRAASGGFSSVSASGITSVFAFGGQGGITDGYGAGGSSGGDGGLGSASADGGNFSGCGGSFTGGAGAASSSAGGGGAGGHGNGGAAANTPVRQGSNGASTGGGGGTYNHNGISPYDYKGGNGGNGKVVISWAEH